MGSGNQDYDFDASNLNANLDLGNVSNVRNGNASGNGNGNKVDNHNKPKVSPRKQSAESRFKELKDLQNMKGLLYKKSSGVLASYKPRYCVLRKHRFKYYKNQNDIKFSGVIDFDLVSCQVHYENRVNPTVFQ